MTIEERLSKIETFLSAFCVLQLVHQGLVEATKEEREGLEFIVASTLEFWKETVTT